jgi:hypothetical protein
MIDNVEAFCWMFVAFAFGVAVGMTMPRPPLAGM